MNRIAPCVFKGCLALAMLGAPQTVFADSLLIKAGKIYTGVGEPITGGAILVVDGKIRQVGTEPFPKQRESDARVVDWKSAVVIPGLVNAYSHIGVEGGDAEVTREITPRFDVYRAINWSSRAFKEALAEGVTTTAVMPGTDNVVAGRASIIKTAGKSAAARTVQSPVGLVATLASDPRSRNRARSRPDTIYVRQPTNRMGVVWMLRAALHASRQPPVASDTPKPFLAKHSPDPLAEVLANKQPLFFVSRTHYDIDTLLRVSKEFDLSPTIIGGQEAHRHKEVLAKNGIGVILESLRLSTTPLTEGIEPVWSRGLLLHQADVQFALSGPHLLRQASFAVRFGLPPTAALKAVTATPAKLLGITDRVGTIAAGRDADLVVLSGEPFEFTTHVRAVVVDGVVYVNGVAQKELASNEQVLKDKQP